jgi:hypothetical protein
MAFALPIFVAYLLTLSPGVGWWDSGELLACAKTLSIAHRPGFPLYILVGHVAYGGMDDPRWIANASSALCASASLLLFWRGFCLLQDGTIWNRIWIGLGGWLVACAPLLWRQAIRIEVYTPVYACLGAAFLLAAAAQRAPDPRSAQRRFLGCIYVLGLAFCLHTAVAVAVWPMVIGLFLLGDFRPALRQWFLAGVLLAAGLSVYAYVPLRTPMAEYVWGQPDHWNGFWAYLTASDSYGIVAAESGGTLMRAGALLDVVLEQSSWLLVTLGLTGLATGALFGHRFGRAPLLLLVSVLAVAATVVSHVVRDNFDLQAYLVPVLWALWWGWSRVNPDTLIASKPALLRWQPALRAAVVVVLIPVLVQSLFAGTRSVEALSLGMADRWGTHLLGPAAPNDLVIIQDANTDFLIRGLAVSHAQFQHVAVLDASLAEAKWYRTWWAKRFPRENAPSVSSPQWIRRTAEEWRSAGRSVFVDYGTSGWLPSELDPAGWLARWDTLLCGSARDLRATVPVVDMPLAVTDPDWVRTVVWYYYRLGKFYHARGERSAAARAWDEGLQWAPGEEALMEARANLAVAYPSGSRLNHEDVAVQH